MFNIRVTYEHTKRVQNNRTKRLTMALYTDTYNTTCTHIPLVRYFIKPPL